MNRLLRSLLFTFLFCLLAAAWAHPLFAGDGDIVLSEIAYNPTCHGTVTTVCAGSTSTETRFEWIEIYNKGSAAVNLNGWQLCDNNGCDTLPNVSVPAGEYWTIGYDATALQTEFNQYSPPYTVNASQSIFLSSPIGGSYGLSNSSDDVYLLNASGSAVDCVSWASSQGTACSSLSSSPGYVPGGDGLDTTLNTALDGQSITNISGVWYKHGPSDAAQQASPYSSNTAAPAGSPTAITLSAFSAAAAPALPTPLPLAAAALFLFLLAGSLLGLRQKLAR